MAFYYTTPSFRTEACAFFRGAGRWLQCDLAHVAVISVGGNTDRGSCGTHGR